MTSRDALQYLATFPHVIVSTDEYFLIRDNAIIHLFCGNRHAKSYPLDKAPELVYMLGGLPGYWRQSRYTYRINYDYMSGLEDFINSIIGKLSELQEDPRIDGDVSDLAQQYIDNLETSMYSYFEPPPSGEEPPDYIGDTLEAWPVLLAELAS